MAGVDADAYWMGCSLRGQDGVLWGGSAGSLERWSGSCCDWGRRTGRMIDGRQWSCACSSVQLWAPEMLMRNESTPGQVNAGQDLTVMLSSLFCVVLCRGPQATRFEQ